ncbi:MAG: hypothetical protein HW400_466 [Candidatus Levybacteria bacterium]|nr:hypothetical protein [Candidatus Levybacteria bacterium]
MKIRNPKHEIPARKAFTCEAGGRNKFKIQIFNVQNVFEFGKFGIISNFDIRILNFPTERRAYG